MFVKQSIFNVFAKLLPVQTLFLPGSINYIEKHTVRVFVKQSVFNVFAKWLPVQTLFLPGSINLSKTNADVKLIV